MVRFIIIFYYVHSLKHRGWHRNGKAILIQETILALIGAYGLESALQKMVGMFALALWDKEEQALFLARDGTRGKSRFIMEPRAR